MGQVARRVKQREAVHHVAAARAAKHDAPAGRVGLGGRGVDGWRSRFLSLYVCADSQLGKAPCSSAAGVAQRVAQRSTTATAAHLESLECRQLHAHKAGSRGSIQQAMLSTASQAPLTCSRCGAGS